MRYSEFTTKWQLPPEPGTTPIPDGHVRLYHQTDMASLGSIKRHGLQLQHARGFEGPKAIYADDRGFYGKPGMVPTIEFHVDQTRWRKPFVKGDVDPKDIIAIHRPWHARVRYIEQDPELMREVLAGEHDHLLDDPQYSKALRFIKHKYAA
jgi:hypothetical protein